MIPTTVLLLAVGASPSLAGQQISIPPDGRLPDGSRIVMSGADGKPIPLGGPDSPMLTFGAAPGSSGGGTMTLASGWSTRVDAGQPQGLQFDSGEKGYHLKPGGVGAILYRGADTVRGPFQASATFSQTKASYSAHGYGLIYGGKDLTNDNLRYVYFFVRGDGKYLIKRRDGANTADIIPWTTSDAIKTVTAQDPAVNTVEIDAKSNPKKIAFRVNGKVIHTMDATPDDLNGVVGLRAGHFLDLQVDGFTITK